MALGKGSVHGAALRSCSLDTHAGSLHTASVAVVRRPAIGRGDNWFALSFYLLPYGLRWFVNALVLASAGGFFIASKWLR